MNRSALCNLTSLHLTWMENKRSESLSINVRVYQSVFNRISPVTLDKIRGVGSKFHACARKLSNRRAPK